MAQPLEAEGQRTPVTMDNDRQPDQITEAEREELVRLLVREPGLIVALFDRAVEQGAPLTQRAGPSWHRRHRSDRDSAHAAMYATWPMRSTGLLRYIGLSERGTFAAVDAKNRSLRKGSTPPGLHVVTDLPRPCAARGAWPRHGDCGRAGAGAAPSC